MGIGKRIKTRREELGLTQQELAERMGYKSKSAINKIEVGVNDVTQKKIVAFAEALDTTIAYLMGWDEDVEESQHHNYYTDDATAKIVEEMATNPELRALYDLQRGLDQDDIQALYGMALALKRKSERFDNDDPA